MEFGFEFGFEFGLKVDLSLDFPAAAEFCCIRPDDDMVLI